MKILKKRWHFELNLLGVLYSIKTIHQSLRHACRHVEFLNESPSILVWTLNSNCQFNESIGTFLYDFFYVRNSIVLYANFFSALF